MSVYVTARFRVRADARDACLRAIREFVAGIRAGEPDTLEYTSVRPVDDPNAFVHFFRFADEAAERRHAALANTKRFVDALYPSLIGEVEFTRYQEVARAR